MLKLITFILVFLNLLNQTYASELLVVTGQTNEGRYLEIVNDRGLIEIFDCRVNSHCSKVGSITDEQFIQLIEQTKKNGRSKKITQIATFATGAIVTFAVLSYFSVEPLSTSREYFGFSREKVLTTLGGMLTGTFSGLIVHDLCKTYLTSPNEVIREQMNLIDENLFSGSCPLEGSVTSERSHRELLYGFRELIDYLN